MSRPHELKPVAVSLLSTAGGRIHCVQCTALSKRSGVQCRRPASKSSKTQKCHMHGGRGNSAPKSEAGRQRVIASHIKSGRHTKDAKYDRSRASARLARLEDAMHVLGLTTASRTRGRKADSYVPVTCIQDVAAMAVDGELHIDGASLEG
jgi:hypothetical protein